MNQAEIKQFLDSLQPVRSRNIIIVDFGNVQKWEYSLSWKIGVRELGNFTKHLTAGSKFLRRFYYGSDFGQNEKKQIPTMWSAAILNKARMSSFEVITIRFFFFPETAIWFACLNICIMCTTSRFIYSARAIIPAGRFLTPRRMA